jgi:hypothetical protein
MRYVRDTYAQSNSGGKSTKKIPYMQIYMGNYAKNVDFVMKIEDFDYFGKEKYT